MVADHERGAVRAELLVDRLREPALVPELEAVAARRQQRERAAEPVVVAVEVRRELPHDRAELAGLGQRLDALVVAADALGEVLKPLDVGHVAARLAGEREVLRRLLDPARDGVGRGQPVEGRVHLDGVEHLRVALEPAALREPVRVEPAAPAVVLPARAADANGPHRRARDGANGRCPRPRTRCRARRAASGGRRCPSRGSARRSRTRTSRCRPRSSRSASAPSARCATGAGSARCRSRASAGGAGPSPGRSGSVRLEAKWRAG